MRCVLHQEELSLSLCSQPVRHHICLNFYTSQILKKIARWVKVTAQILYLLNISHWQPNMIGLFSEIFEWKLNFWERTRISLYQSRVLRQGQEIGNYLSISGGKNEVNSPENSCCVMPPSNPDWSGGTDYCGDMKSGSLGLWSQPHLRTEGTFGSFSSRTFLMPANQKTQLPQDEIQDNKQMHNIQDTYGVGRIAL